MRDPATIKARSEFRPGTTKVFKNGDAQAVTKNLSDRQRNIEAARAAFFDVEGIENMDLTPAA